MGKKFFPKKRNYNNNNENQGGNSNIPTSSRGVDSDVRGDGNPRRYPDQQQPSTSAPLPGRNNNQNNNRNQGFRQSAGPMRTAEQLAAVKPANLSTSSNDKNDPMIQKSFVIEGSLALTPADRTPEFQIDFSQYQVLINTSYQTIVRVDSKFGSTVSESMYNYYCCILLWRRLYHVLSERGEFQVAAREFDTIFQYCKVQVPKDLDIYLSGIGNVVDFCQRKAELSLQTQCLMAPRNKDASGSFGQINAATHQLYETLPAPIIALCRISADMVATQDGQPAQWDVPVNIAPNIQNAEVNVNLLGYKRSQPLAPEQLRALQGVGFDPDSFGINKHIDNVPINSGLLMIVGEGLGKSKVSVSVPETAQYNGSASQVLFTDPERLILYDRNRVRVAENATTKSFAQTGVNIASGAVAFRYRFHRSMNDDDFYGLCYIIRRSGNELEPPPGWLAHENDIYNHVPPIWNITRFITPIAFGHDAAQAVSDSAFSR